MDSALLYGDAFSHALHRIQRPLFGAVHSLRYQVVHVEVRERQLREREDFDADLPGDSGSPHYKEFTFNGETKASIIMPHYGGESIGCAAYRIHNVHGIEFGI